MEQVEEMLKIPKTKLPMTEDEEATAAYIKDNLNRLVCVIMPILTIVMLSDIHALHFL